ncbi:MAG: hypothetical protein C4324_00965 [Blastocatellia bacterium]
MLLWIFVELIRVMRRIERGSVWSWALTIAVSTALILVSENPPATGQIQPVIRPQEISESDGIPVLIKHLPDWENARGTARLASTIPDLKLILGDRSVFSEIEMIAGSEAVTAEYSTGRLLLIEFPTPQASSAADAAILQNLAQTPSPGTFYRRIGNYNAFVFDATSEHAAEELLDQIKYEKTVQWLGEDPYHQRKLERYLVGTSVEVLISTIIFILLGLGGSIAIGVIAGFAFFRIRDQRRTQRIAFSDAGGLTRLNLDGLSEQIEPKAR